MPWRIYSSVELKDGTKTVEEIPSATIFKLGVQDMARLIVEELEDYSPDDLQGAKVTIVAERT